MARGIFWFAGLILVIYLLFTAILFVFQRSLIYLPQPRAASEAAALRLPNDAGELMVTLRPHDGPNALIYFGGNAEDVSLNLPDFAESFPDHALYLMHYRGFAGSDGSPGEIAIRQDALSLFDAIAGDHRCVLVMGRSLGSAIATHVAAQREVSRLILITPFNSLEELAARQFPFIPVHWLLRDRYHTWRDAPGVAAPTLLVAAENDRIVPRQSTEALLGRFSDGLASLAVIPDRGHNTLHMSDAYAEVLARARCPEEED
ncbi:alpha/beta hydrolase [Stutzerimonas tarimensis]|uniref:Alpha/beta hydrolase n=1 Tax=Stutzerimonas tarimensis TaxID=1507735 RepID=A0ABV7T269_9GAMM